MAGADPHQKGKMILTTPVLDARWSELPTYIVHTVRPRRLGWGWGWAFSGLLVSCQKEKAQTFDRRTKQDKFHAHNNVYMHVTRIIGSCLGTG